jgi:hypothetical protein
MLKLNGHKNMAEESFRYRRLEEPIMQAKIQHTSCVDDDFRDGK